MYASTSRDANSRSMRTALVRTSVSSLVLGAVFFAFPVFADIIPNHDFSTPVASNDSNVNFYIGSSTVAGFLSDVSVWLGDSTGGSGTIVSVRVTCFANDTNSSQTGCTSAAAFESQSLTIYNTFGQEYFFSLATPISLQVGKYYLLEILGATGSDKPVVYGAATLQWPVQCSFAGGSAQCTGTPYFTTNAAPDWSGINATSTPLTALYQGGASSTLTLIQARCTGTGGGIFGEAICAAFSFLFVPDPAILNGYASLASTTIPSKFPFSYVAGVSAAFGSLTASSTDNLASVTLPFHSIGVGSTTPLGLANIVSADITAFSSSTIETYIPAGTWAFFQSLIALGIWLTFAADVFFTVRNQMHRV